jgi:hypothetical protein
MVDALGVSKPASRCIPSSDWRTPRDRLKSRVVKRWDIEHAIVGNCDGFDPKLFTRDKIEYVQLGPFM